MESFGASMRAIRKRRRVSLRKASGEIGISPAYLSDIENGKRKPPLGELLETMLTVYKVNADERLRLMELIGLAREELPPDMVEFLMHSEYARQVVRELMGNQQSKNLA